MLTIIWQFDTTNLQFEKKKIENAMCPRCNEAEHNKMRYACPVGGVKIGTITLEKKNWHHSVKLNICVMNNPTVPIQVNTM